MLTSFFGKSKPINYILLSIAIIIGYFLRFLTSQKLSLGLDSLGTEGILIFLMVFAVLLLDFIIRKNNVTKNNTFAILLFVFFVLLVPQVYKSPQLILANIFVLLATRRILSLTTEKNTVKKISLSNFVPSRVMGHKLRILGSLVLWSSVISHPNCNNLRDIRKKALF